MNRSRSTIPERQPYVYLSCGHVHGHEAQEWEPIDAQIESGNQRQCPLCRKVISYHFLLLFVFF